MSIKSTVELTRDEAEEKYRDQTMRWMQRGNHLSNAELEEALETMNDVLGDGRFENYRIRPQPPSS